MRRAGEAPKLGGEGRQRGEKEMEGEEGEGYFKRGKVFVLLSSHHHLSHLPASLPKTSLKEILLLTLRCKEGPDSHICVAVMQHRDLLHRTEDPKKEILRL